jgi:glycosyltransferase involved in cell wall biosynthesis
MREVAIVTNSIGGGGAERAMNLLANELIKRNFSVTLIPINLGPPDSIQLKCKICPLERSPSSNLSGTFQALKHFRKLIQNINPDYIVLNCDLPELFGLFLPRQKNLIVVEHANPAWSTRQTVGRVTRFLHRLRKTSFFAVSSHLTIWPRGTLPKNIVNNIVEVSQAKLANVTVQNRLMRLVFIGRLARVQKRPAWLIKIAHELSIPVLFIGLGEEENSLKNLAVKEGVRAEFIGYQINPWSFLAQGDLVVVPSLFEGDGLVAVEAIANRVPVILSDIFDFRRFNLPDRFYATTLSEFVDKIHFYKESIDNLIVPTINRVALLQDRTPEVVGDVWEYVFNEKGVTK